MFIFLLFHVAFASVQGPLTDDFRSWLDVNGYKGYDFARDDYGSQGSFGGKTENAPEAVNTPIIFIHGNSDAALHKSSSATGWTKSINYFLTQGYTVAELYATSWQDTNVMKAGTRTHNCHDLERLRKYVEAVLSYTNKTKVSLVTHSMGVTMGRKIVKGGAVKGNDGSCDLGAAINHRIEVFIGISGGNYGLCNCEGSGALLEATCNKDNGLWPGDSCGMNYLTCGLSPLTWPCSSHKYSEFLMQLNEDTTKEADYVFSSWSHADNVILYNDIVWGKPTSFIPTSDGKLVYSSLTHVETKDLTAKDQYIMINKHVLPF